MDNKGRTRRIKSFHANTGGEDSGLHEWNDSAIFTQAKDENVANAGQYLIGHGFHIAIKSENNQAVLMVVDKNTNAWRNATWGDAYVNYVKQNPQMAAKPLAFQYIKYPALGWNILELTYKPDKSLSSIHFGSPVSKVLTQLTQQDLKDFGYGQAQQTGKPELVTASGDKRARPARVQAGEERLFGQRSVWLKNIRNGLPILTRKFGDLIIGNPGSMGCELSADLMEDGQRGFAENLDGHMFFIQLEGDELVIRHADGNCRLCGG